MKIEAFAQDLVLFVQKSNLGTFLGLFSSKTALIALQLQQNEGDKCLKQVKKCLKQVKKRVQVRFLYKNLGIPAKCCFS